MDSKDFQWYALKAISGKETKVKEYIETDIRNRKLEKYVPQVLIPVRKEERVVRGKRKIQEVSLLPGYVLVEACLIGEIPHLLRNTPGVLGFLGGKEKPTALRQHEINRMMGVDVDEEIPAVVRQEFTVGESVTVTDGPFSGFNAVVDEVYSDKQKLKVAVKIFGRVTPLELSYGQVDKE